jgi:ParB/RepB/Spo0J family partition protein
MVYKVSNVSPADINLEDHAFRITTTQDKASLLESIEKFGLLQPPTIWPHATGLIVVSGFRRIRACQQLGLQAIPARWVAKDLRPLDCLRMALTENITQRALNLVEMARAVRRVRLYCPTGHKTAEELALLGLPSSQSMINKLERLGGLPSDLQAAVVDGTISLNTALEVGNLERRDQLAVRGLFCYLRLSVGKQREILGMARDIAGRDKKTIADVLHADAVSAIVDDDQMDRNQKTKIIRRYLKKTRYPHRTAFETQYTEAVNALKLGPHMRIDPPADFEGTTFTLSLRFENRCDLASAYRTIGTLLQDANIDSIFPKL